MQPINFEETLEQILRQDSRYRREAYLFVREALDYTQKTVTKAATKEEIRHVTGQELLQGIRGFTLEQFGPMSITVLDEWGVRACEDFGEIVFNMVEASLLAKTKTDTREDFKEGYTFDDAFRRPYLPARRNAEPASASEAQAAKV